MTPSEKVELIKKISRVLSKEKPDVINLTLKQFRFPVSKLADTDTFSYVLKKIQNGTRSQLEKLGAHLEHIDSRQKIKVNPSFWKEGYFRLFISHLSKRRETAAELKQQLENFGITCFVAHRDIKVSKKWQDEIELALQTCDGFVAMLTRGFHSSAWTDHEVGFAFGRGTLIIPVNMGEAPYGFMAKVQAYKYRDIPQLSDHIFELLATNEQTAKQMAYAAMLNFEQSDSFAQARVNLGLLRKIKYWDKTLMVRLKKAPENNRQVGELIGVSQRIEGLIRKVKKSVT